MHAKTLLRVMPDARLLVATDDELYTVDAELGRMGRAKGLEERAPGCLAADPHISGHAWCGIEPGGVLRTEDGGDSWLPAGLQRERVSAIAASPTERDVVWAGTEPSEVWRSGDGGRTWHRTHPLAELPSSSEWSFPPKPETHHVRWIACRPHRPGALLVAIEAGALVSTADAGRTWRDRVSGGPYDTHELAIHPIAPETLRVAAGDGYFESLDGGATWTRPRRGLDVSYMRSVAIDPGRPDVVVVSAASHPFAAYRAGASDGRLYRRAGDDDWTRVTSGWPDPPATIAPILVAGARSGEMWAADERGVHRSRDGGATWSLAAPFPKTPRQVDALALMT